MRGLWIKDLILIFKQKKLLLGFILIAALNGYVNDSSTFIFLFMNFFFISITTSTVFYDQQNHGYEFLFSLPITKKAYVLEKQLLNLLFSVASLLLSFALAFVINVYKGETLNFLTLLQLGVASLLFANLYSAVTIPLYIRFGSEHGRTVLIALVGIFVVLGFIFEKTGLTTAIAASQWFISLLNLAILPFLGLVLLVIALLVGISTIFSEKLLNQVI